MARDCARRKAFWKQTKAARQLSPVNRDTHCYARLQETRTVASPQVSVVSHLENSVACLEPFVSEPNKHLTVERGTINTARILSDLLELYAVVTESDLSSILEELDFRKCLFDQPHEPDSDLNSPSVCANCTKEGEELPFCTGCRYVRYCSKNCQVADWSPNSHSNITNFRRQPIIHLNLFITWFVTTRFWIQHGLVLDPK